MTVEQAEREIESFLASFPFSVDPQVFERLDERRSSAVARSSPPSLAYSEKQEVRMLADFARRVGPLLDRRADEVRTRPTFVLDGVRTDWVADAIRNDRIQAQTCRILALSGTSARVRRDDRTALLEAGFAEEDIDEIDGLAQQHATREAALDWTVGPEREVLAFHLQSVGALPTTENILRLRRAALFVLANMLESYARHYQSVPNHYEAMAVAPAELEPLAVTVPFAPELFARVSAEATATVPRSTSTPAPIVPTASDTSLIDLVERLILGKTQAKSREWDDKTARQLRSIAKLFVKNAKTDDPARLTQAHVGSYLDLLRIIPTHHGKSSADEDRCIEEILARAEDLDEDEIGLAPRTINRHRTQLGAILAHAEQHGFHIGVISKNSRAKDNEPPGSKRSAFNIHDGVRLMSRLDAATRNPGHLITDALFWVPVLAWYMVFRLSEAAGLAPEDIDVARGLIHIRKNQVRRVKTHAATRTLPILPEIKRLGFLDLVKQRQAEGSKQLFPELFGRKTEFATVFQKQWAPVLDAALPTARRERKTLHSTRKTGNTAMHVAAVKDNTRFYIMGHTKVDVNGRHYLEPLPQRRWSKHCFTFPT